MSTKIQEIQVNDSSLTQQKEIYFKDILAIAKPVLAKHNFSIADIDIIWLKFPNEIRAMIDYVSPRKDDFHAVYIFDIEDHCCLGVYQLFSGKIYVVESQYIVDVEAINGNLQFALGYKKTGAEAGATLYNVSRFSRCFTIRDEAKFTRKVLTACEDREVVKNVCVTGDVSAKEAFVQKDGAEDIRHYEAMFFDKFNKL